MIRGNYASSYENSYETFTIINIFNQLLLYQLQRPHICSFETKSIFHPFGGIIFWFFHSGPWKRKNANPFARHWIIIQRQTRLEQSRSKWCHMPGKSWTQKENWICKTKRELVMLFTFTIDISYGALEFSEFNSYSWSNTRWWSLDWLFWWTDDSLASWAVTAKSGEW